MSQKPKSKRKTSKHETTNPNPTPTEFSCAIARVAVSQITESVGFRTAKPSALETLTRVAAKYMEAVASASASYAAMANRTDANVFDMVNALQDLQAVQGFRGAASLHDKGFCVLGSSVLGDLARFVRWNEETPFARPIPRRGVKMGGGNGIPIPLELDSPRDSHVPRWLPGFPEVEKKAVGKRRSGEELWEENLLVGNENVSESGNGNGVRLEMGFKNDKTGRVRFRIGFKEEKGVVVGLPCGGGGNSTNKIGHNFNTRIDPKTIELFMENV